jgi:NADH dehydrogenase [ubiquinone] 1 alpha subcomplex assembly factor 7
MIGIWCLSMWEKMGKPDKVYIVELGPGKGTLMKDIMRVAGRFQPFASAVSVHFVELSAVLRGTQYHALGCAGASTVGSSSATTTAGTTAAAGKEGALGIKEGVAYPMQSGVKVHWHSFLQQVPSDAPALIIGTSHSSAFTFCPHCKHTCIILQLCTYIY